MKRILVFFASTIVISCNVKADTVDFWAIYYNGKLWKNFNSVSDLLEGNHGNLLTLNLKTIKPGDSISIQYFGDVIGYDVKSHISIEDSNQNVLEKITGNRSFIMFRAKNLIKIRGSTGSNLLYFYYYQNTSEFGNNRKNWTFLFRIKLE